jgi:hypothetical protein
VTSPHWTEAYPVGSRVEFKVTVESVSGGFPLWLEAHVVSSVDHRPGSLRLVFGEGEQMVSWETRDLTGVRACK